MKVVLATGNAGKVREFAEMLAPLDLQLIAQGTLGIESADETGVTFEDNALLKARHAAARSGMPAMADDSGLEVDALGGAPGVYSARYAGPGADDAANMAKLLAALAGIEPESRRARFRCVIAFVRAADDPHPIFGTGRWEGTILTAPRGTGGFGYDPVFAPLDAAGASVAELEAARKHAASHRGQALRDLLQRLPRAVP